MKLDAFGIKTLRLQCTEICSAIKICAFKIYGIIYPHSIKFGFLSFELSPLSSEMFNFSTVERQIITKYDFVSLQKANFRSIKKNGTFKFRKIKNRFISHSDMKNIDPADLHACKAHGILFAERFYKTGPGVQAGIESGMGEKTVVMMVDGSKMVPYEVISRLSKENIMKIRAGDLRGVSLVATLALILLVFSFIINYAEYYLLEFTGQHIMQDIRLKLFEKMQSYAVRFFDRNPVGRLVTRVTNDIENLNEMFKSVIVTVFKDFFTSKNK